MHPDDLRRHLHHLAEAHGAPSSLVESLLALAEAHREADGEALAAAGGRFRRVRLLGRGGMGEVWEVEDLLLGRSVALKLARADRPDLLAREARLTARLAHPGVLPLLELVTLSDGATGYLMPIAPGASLASALAAGDLRLTAGVRTLERAARAVAWAHAHGIVHRDLKPDNVLLGGYGEVYVADWGLGGGPDEPALAGGTPGFMAPEQAAGAPARPTDDVWALGAMLRDVGRAGLPRPLAAVADRACAARPEDRYPHAGAFADELERWAEGAPVIAHAYDPVERLLLFTRRHRALGLGGVASLVVGVVVTTAWSVDARATAQSVMVAAAESALADRNLPRAGALAAAVLERGEDPRARGVAVAAFGAPTARLRWSADDQASCRWLEWSPDGQWLVCGDGATGLRVYAADGRRFVGRQPARAVGFVDGAAWAAVAGGGIARWALPDWTPLPPLVLDLPDPAVQQILVLDTGAVVVSTGTGWLSRHARDGSALAPPTRVEPALIPGALFDAGGGAVGVAVYGQGIERVDPEGVAPTLAWADPRAQGVATRVSAGWVATRSSDSGDNVAVLLDPSGRERTELHRRGRQLPVAVGGGWLARAAHGGGVDLVALLDPPPEGGAPPGIHLPAPAGLGVSLALTPDGHSLAVALLGVGVRMWDLPDPSVFAWRHRAVVRGVGLSEDGRRGWSCGQDDRLRVWSAPEAGSPTPEREVALDGSPLCSVARRAPGGAVYATDGARGVVRIDGDGTIRRATVEAPGSLLSIAPDPSGRHVVVTGSAGFAALLDPDTLTTRWSLAGLPAGESALGAAFDAQGRVWIGSVGGGVHGFRVADGAPVTTLGDGGPTAGRPQVSPDGRWLAIGLRDDRIHLWDLHTLQALPPWRRLRGWPLELAFLGEGRRLASAGFDGALRVWGVPDGALLAELDAGRELHHLAAGPGGRHLVAAGAGPPDVYRWLLDAVDTPAEELAEEAATRWGLVVERGQVRPRDRSPARPAAPLPDRAPPLTAR